MGTTTNHAFRYPENSSAVAVPLDLKKLADDIDAIIFTSQGGTITGATSFTHTVTVQPPTLGNHPATKDYVDGYFPVLPENIDMHALLQATRDNAQLLDGGTAIVGGDLMWDAFFGEAFADSGVPSSIPEYVFYGETL